MSTVIRQASIQDKNAIWDFNYHAYGDAAKYKLPERWNWEYLENPETDKDEQSLPIFIALKDGQIVGQICAILYQIKIGDKMYRMACGVDFIVLPVCRGEGVGQKLIQAIAEHYGLYMVISMGEITRRIYYRLDYSEFKPIPTYRRLVKLSGEEVFNYLSRKTANHLVLNRIVSILCRLKSDKLIAFAGNILIAARDFLLKCGQRRNQTEICEIVNFDEDINSLWNSTNSKFKVIVKRDKKYLNWRFSKKSSLDYKCFIGKRHGSIKGYIVLRKPAAVELNIGIIVDIYTEQGDHEMIEDLIRHAIEFFADSVTVIECPTTRQEHQIALSKLGFLKMGKTVPIFFCKDAELKKELDSLNQDWFLTKSDHDWDQLHPVT